MKGRAMSKKLLLIVLSRLGRGVRSLLNFEPEQQQALSLMQCGAGETQLPGR